MVSYDEVGIYNSRPIPEGLAVLRRLNGAGEKVDRTYDTERMRCRAWAGTSGKTLEICLHAKGHSIPAEWVAEGLDWLDGLPGGG